ncbi:hypothetical protein T01_5131 [Trichinella spiralis]|uniref:Uncharacterized protein n=1 Tax=Trichinella spiralis TaxID=6334 RepID=A0A0V0Z195_TRISP|nr:hypothetical protein T01_5131 [Trichinella spiralis]
MRSKFSGRNCNKASETGHLTTGCFANKLPIKISRFGISVSHHVLTYECCVYYNRK